MSAHRYGWPALRGDFIRAGIGLACSAGALALAWHNVYALWFFLLCVGVFAVFGLRTLDRVVTEYELTGHGIRRTNGGLPFRRNPKISWSGLTKLSLRFYSTKRDRSEGWMQMTLSGPDGRISLDSTIDDFDAIARAAAVAAMRNEMTLKPSTLANFDALGINLARLKTEDDAAPPAR